MKKSLLLALAAAVALGVYASGPYVREAGKGGFKALTAPESLCRATPSPAIAPAPAKAPENAIETLPFESPLGKNDEKMSTYTILDANGDGRTWNVKTASYAACMGPNSADFQCADDWLITPAIHLYAGKDYKFSIKAAGMTTLAKKGEFTFLLGTEPTAEAMTTTLVEKAQYDGTSSYTLVEKDFTVPADGYYYIGLYCTTDKDISSTSRLKELKIEETVAPVDAPAAGSIEYSVHPGGEMLIDVTYTAPTKTQSGSALTAISKVEIFNWMYPNAADKIVIEDAEPGHTYTGTVKAMEGGNNRIRAIAYTGETAGDIAETANFYAGLDMPGDASNVHATLSDDFTKVTVSWDPVSTVGENGGYVNPDEVKYYIFDAFGSYYDPALAEEVTSPYTFDYSAATEQDFVAFQITAGNSKGYSIGNAFSNVVVVGRPENMPWNESFTNCRYGAAWMQDMKTSGNMMTGLWYDDELQTNTDAPDGTEPEYLNSHDLDNGFLLMLPYAKDDCFGLNSVKISLAGAAKPVYEFFYQGKGSRLEVLVAADGADFEVVRTIDLKTESTDDWTLCRIPLDDYKQAKYIQVGYRMKAIHNTDDTTWSVPVDNFRVIDLADVDLRLSYAALPELQAGKKAEVSVSVENMGTKTAEAAAVRLYVDGEVADEVTAGDMAAGAVTAHKLSYTPDALSPDAVDIKVAVEAAADAYTANNTAEASDVAIAHSALPGVENLGSEKPGDNTVVLSWDVPEYAHMTETKSVTDDFENPDYPDFEDVQCGEWKFDDLDNKRNYTFMYDYDNPYRGITMGFQIFNYKKAGLPESQLIDAMPHSGDRQMVAWSCGGYNDNWLISPELSGDEQVVKFYARSFTSAYPEEFEVHYSTTDSKTASFAYLDGSLTSDVPETWTEYSFTLPKGAKYFAIRHTAYDTYALFVDDVTYEAPSAFPADLALTGYNVYRNGDMHINVAEAGHTDEPGADGKFAYRVSAVYNYGESRACAAHEVDFEYSGLADLAADGIIVEVDADGISITAPDAVATAIYAADGMKLHSGFGSARVTLPAGVYLVSAGRHIVKVAVK